MVYWRFTICFAVLAILQLSKINADEDAASNTNIVQDVNSNAYDSNAAITYTDSYADYYAHWTPEMYQKYGLPQDYFQQFNRKPLKPLRKQDVFSQMSNLLGPDPGEAALTVALVSGLFGLLGVVGVLVNAGSINDLSEDQDSICTTTQALGNTAIGTIDVGGNTQALINAALLKITTVIDGYATPTC